jgi:hypothetical protein
MSRPRPIRVATLLVVTLAACGSVESGDPDGQPTSDGAPGSDGPADTVAPTVVDVTPGNGTAGVAADAVITIVFSEPMAQGSVRGAWSSADLPSSAVAFEWNASGDTLTVRPDDPLEYAVGVGTDPSGVVPRAYAFQLGVAATDVAGNPLAAAIDVAFTTKRRMRAELAVITDLTRFARGDGTVFNTSGTNLAIGDTNTNLQYKTFVGFELPTLPAGATLERATFGASQNGPVGTPYLLGAVEVRHVNTATIDAAAFAAIPLADLGVLATDGTLGAHTLDVTAAFADDLANHVARGERSQYRLEYDTPTNSNAANDYANFSRNGWGLAVIYVVD